MQVEDQELKTWVVRSDVGVKPAWLKQDRIVGAKPILDVTEDEAEAHQVHALQSTLQRRIGSGCALTAPRSRAGRRLTCTPPGTGGRAVRFSRASIPSPGVSFT